MSFSSGRRNTLRVLIAYEAQTQVIVICFTNNESKKAMIGIKPHKDKKATEAQLIEITIINTTADPTRPRRLPKVVQAVKYFTKLANVAGYSDKETAKILGR